MDVIQEEQSIQLRITQLRELAAQAKDFQEEFRVRFTTDCPDHQSIKEVMFVSFVFKKSKKSEGIYF